MDISADPVLDVGKGQAHLVLATKHVLAFLDIMPLTRGHTLLVTRKHHQTLAEVGVETGMEVRMEDNDRLSNAIFFFFLG